MAKIINGAQIQISRTPNNGAEPQMDLVKDHAKLHFATSGTKRASWLGEEVLFSMTISR